MRIYTKTGDTGETALFDGTRVSKADDRVAAYGDVDELNAWLGFVRTDGVAPDLDAAIVQIQRDLFAVGAQLADPAHRIAARVGKATVTDEDVSRLEQLIDRLEHDLPPLTHFILAGGGRAGAGLHVARAVCRRAERRIVALTPQPEGVVLRYVNRLSDLLFVMARVSNHREQRHEEIW